MKRVVVPSINNFGPIQTKEGEYIEEKVRRITENGEPIEDGAPIIYTERKTGVNPEYNIRTDRFMIAMEAMGKISNYKTSEYLRNGNAEVENKNNGNQGEADKNGNEEIA